MDFQARTAPSARSDMPANSPYPAPFDTSTFIFPAEWHAFSDLLGGADTGVLFLREGVILHLNNHLAEQLGFDEEELVGKPVESLFPSGNGTAVHEDAHIRLLTKTGEARRFHLIDNHINALSDASCMIWVLQPEGTQASRTASAMRLQAITEYLPDLVAVCNPDSTLTYANKAFDQLVGHRGDRLAELVHQEDLAKMQAALGQASTSEAAVPFAFRLRQHDGAWRHVAGEARNMLAHREIGGLLLNARDITEQLLQQQDMAAEKKRQLHYLNRLLRLAQRPHADVISALKVILKSTAKALGTHRCAYWEISDDAAMTRCMLAYDDIRQNIVEEAPDVRFATVFHPLLLQVLRSEHQIVIADVDQDPRAALYCEYFHAHGIKAMMMMPVRIGARLPGMLILSHLHEARHWRKDESDFADNVAGLITLLFNQAERGRTEAQLRHIANHDSLTGLPNRHYLFDQAADIFPKLTASTSSLAAFFIDLDGFKHINDSLGHSVGDELLKASAMRLKNVVRKDDILVRLGGDEFMLLARNLGNPQIAEDIAGQIVNTMRNTFSLQGRALQISASVGIALYPFDGTDIDTLMKKSDIAMYHAKASGRDQYQMFAPRFNDGFAGRSALERELRRAIEEHELRHYYQPQVDLRTGKVRCVEALLRWRHPQRGLLLPADFLPLAEESDLIHRISAWALNDACEQLRAWSSRGMEELHIAINLSASQLMDRALLPALESALARSAVDGARLEWEIKENIVMQEHALGTSMLDRAMEMNVSLSIDDFGTGYSNMAWLRRYPVHKVKIDRSFIHGLPDEGDNRAIADAIISMAQPLGLDVVAEGVETAQQMAYLRERGCAIAQGYYFTQPLTAEQFETWLIRH
jgi:diguanylate cyclase (GGDEF)-like protein/PAS domain S-box-containing protein